MSIFHPWKCSKEVWMWQFSEFGLDFKALEGFSNIKIPRLRSNCSKDTSKECFGHFPFGFWFFTRFCSCLADTEQCLNPAWSITLNFVGFFFFFFPFFPLVSPVAVREMILHPYETQSDSFYFVDNKLVMHNKADYSYSGGPWAWPPLPSGIRQGSQHLQLCCLQCHLDKDPPNQGLFATVGVSWHLFFELWSRPSSSEVLSWNDLWVPLPYSSC